MLSRSSLCAALAIALLASAAHGAVATSTSTTLGTNNLATGPKSVTAGDTLVTFTAAAPDGSMLVDQDGIEISGNGELLNITFNKAVTVTGYGIGSADGPGPQIEYYVDNGTSFFATGTDVGTHNFPTPLDVQVGSVFTINGPPGFLQLNQITFNVIPEPAAAGLVAIGGLALLRRRRHA